MKPVIVLLFFVVSTLSQPGINRSLVKAENLEWQKLLATYQIAAPHIYKVLASFSSEGGVRYIVPTDSSFLVYVGRSRGEKVKRENMEPVTLLPFEVYVLPEVTVLLSNRMLNTKESAHGGMTMDGLLMEIVTITHDTNNVERLTQHILITAEARQQYQNFPVHRLDLPLLEKPFPDKFRAVQVFTEKQ